MTSQSLKSHLVVPVAIKVRRLSGSCHPHNRARDGLSRTTIMGAKTLSRIHGCGANLFDLLGAEQVVVGTRPDHLLVGDVSRQPLAGRPRQAHPQLRTQRVRNAAGAEHRVEPVAVWELGLHLVEEFGRLETRLS